MTFREGLIHARSHIIFLFALATVFGLILRLESATLVPPSSNDEGTGGGWLELEPSAERPVPRLRPLSDEERHFAEIAWRYFEKNLQPTTGLVDTAAKYPSTTLWDTGSYLLAVIAAHGLGLIDKAEVDFRLDKALQSLAAMPLFAGLLPNKSYHTITLEMVDYANQPTESGIGWSALDVGRILIPFQILVWRYPQHNEAVHKVLAAWSLEAAVGQGKLYGATAESGGIRYLQEGRLGYEEYGARAFAILGFDTSVAVRYGDFLKWVDIYRLKIAVDNRAPEIFGAHDHVVSEPYILDGLELGWDRISAELAYRVYRVQQERFRQTGILTAVTEDHLDRAPHFAYNSIYVGGRLWHAITPGGEDASEHRTLSTKAAFGWDALYDTPYTRRLVSAVRRLYDPEGGWYAGLYERSGQVNRILTCNTNAVILESLYRRQSGPLLETASQGDSASEAALKPRGANS